MAMMIGIGHRSEACEPSWNDPSLSRHHYWTWLASEYDDSSYFSGKRDWKRFGENVVWCEGRFGAVKGKWCWHYIMNMKTVKFYMFLIKIIIIVYFYPYMSDCRRIQQLGNRNELAAEAIVKMHWSRQKCSSQWTAHQRPNRKSKFWIFIEYHTLYVNQHTILLLSMYWIQMYYFHVCHGQGSRIVTA